MPIFNEAHTPSAHFSESRFNGPTALQTTWNRNDSIEDTEDYSLGNVPGKVVITFKINKLPYAREYWNPRFDQFVGEVKPWMHSMDRSFGFHLSEFIPMKKGRGRGAELHRDNGGPWNESLHWSYSADGNDFHSDMMNTTTPLMGGTSYSTTPDGNGITYLDDNNIEQNIPDGTYDIGVEPADGLVEDNLTPEEIQNVINQYL